MIWVIALSYQGCEEVLAFKDKCKCLPLFISVGGG